MQLESIFVTTVILRYVHGNFVQCAFPYNGMDLYRTMTVLFEDLIPLKGSNCTILDYNNFFYMLCTHLMTYRGAILLWGEELVSRLHFFIIVYTINRLSVSILYSTFLMLPRTTSNFTANETVGFLTFYRWEIVPLLFSWNTSCISSNASVVMKGTFEVPYFHEWRTSLCYTSFFRCMPEHICTIDCTV